MTRKSKNISDTQDRNHKACELQRIESGLKTRQDNLKIAEANVSEGNLKLQHALAQKVLSKKGIQSAQSLKT